MKDECVKRKRMYAALECVKASTKAMSKALKGVKGEKPPKSYIGGRGLERSERRKAT